MKQLIKAIKEGNINAVINYIKNDKAIINDYIENGMTALHLAIQYRNIELVKALVNNFKKTISLDKRIAKYCSKERETPISHAIMVDAPGELLKFLLDNNADPNIPLCNKTTPLMQAIVNNNSEYFNTLILFWRKLDVNALNSFGETALHIAAIEGKKEQVKILMGIPCINIEAKRHTDNKTAKEIVRDKHNDEITALLYGYDLARCLLDSIEKHNFDLNCLFGGDAEDWSVITDCLKNQFDSSRHQYIEWITMFLSRLMHGEMHPQPDRYRLLFNSAEHTPLVQMLVRLRKIAAYGQSDQKTWGKIIKEQAFNDFKISVNSIHDTSVQLSELNQALNHYLFFRKKEIKQMIKATKNETVFYVKNS